MNRIIRALIILLLPLTTMGALTVNNGGGATNITSTSAWITATIVSTGAANPYLYSYWGTNSGGTNAMSWGHTNSYGLSTQAAYSVQITGLSGSTIYYFRTHATNTYDTTNSESAWASYTAQFITLTTPTSAPPSSIRAVTVDTNAVLKNPTNFFIVNSNLILGLLSSTYALQADYAATTNVVESLKSGTGTWNQAAVDASSWTSSVAHGITGSDTDRWNTAATDASAGTNAFVAQGLTNAMFSAQIGSNTAAVVNLANATNYINSVMATGTPLYVYSETDPVWSAVSNLYATGTPLYVYSETDPVWSAVSNLYATGTPLYVYSETDPVWSAVSNLYATGTPLYVESYLGTIIGASIAAGDADAVTTNAGMLAITWNTNAAGGGAVGIDTNSNFIMANGTTGSFDGLTVRGTLMITNSASAGVPEPVEVMEDAPSDDSFNARRNGVWTNLVTAGLYATGSPVYVEADPVWSATKLAKDDGGDLTNVTASVDYGITDSTAYRGDWGNAVSGSVDSLIAATGALHTAVGERLPLAGAVMTGYLTNLVGFVGNGAGLTNITADGSLPLTGGIMTGPLTNEAGFYGNGAGLTNVVEALPKSVTNALAVTALQITGGGPTNGAILVATNIAGQMIWQSSPLVDAKMSGNQPLAMSTWTIIGFSNEVTDTHNEYNPATCRFTPSRSGHYLLYAQWGADSVPTNLASHYIAVYQNGSNIRQTQIDIPSGGPSEETPNITVIITAVPPFTNYYEIYGKIVGSANKIYNNSRDTHFQAVYLP